MVLITDGLCFHFFAFFFFNGKSTFVYLSLGKQLLTQDPSGRFLAVRVVERCCVSHRNFFTLVEVCGKMLLLRNLKI